MTAANAATVLSFARVDEFCMEATAPDGTIYQTWMGERIVVNKDTGETVRVISREYSPKMKTPTDANRILPQSEPQ